MGKGNTIFLDGNIATMEDSLRRLQALTRETLDATESEIAQANMPPTA
jgi:hypothetical protein